MKTSDIFPNVCKGFTLPELIVVLVIIGLASALVFPNLFRFYDSYSRWLETREVTELFNQLGKVARKQGRKIDEKSFLEDGFLNDYFPSFWVVKGKFLFLENGSCVGGEVSLIYKDIFFTQKSLQGPFCFLTEDL